MAYTTATLTGTYQTFDGTPASGTVEIIPNSSTLVDGEGNVILSGRVKVTLDATGSFSAVLPATDDATVEPALGRQYTVVAKLRHQHLAAVTGIELATGQTRDMADLTSAAAVTASLSTWLTQEDYVALEADVAGRETPAGAQAKADAAQAAAVAASTPVAHLTDTANPHAVTKAQVGLGSVDNTSDASKPVSTAQAAALALKLDAASSAVDAAVAARVNDTASTTRAALSATFVERALAPASRLSVLPGRLDNRRFNNSMSHAQDSVTTVDGVQYAVWSDSARKPTIGKRTLPDGAWATYDLTAGPAFLNAVTTLDEHNHYSVAVDANGYIHVSGNMHGDWLRYARSTNPGDITAWTAGAMIGTATAPDTATERAISYPRFFTHPDGTLFYTYRNGSSGNADQYLNRYNAATGTWTRIGKLVDGISTAEGPYVDHVVCDTDGVIHVSGQWRPSGGGTTDTNDLFYFRSPDKGATWESVTGSALTLPITHATSPLVIDTPASGYGLNNSCGLGVDTQGRPHLANLITDGSGITQVLHAWHDGTTWQTETVTAWTKTGVQYVPRPQVICPANGRTYILARHFFNGWRASVRLIDVTPGGQRVDFPIADFDLRDSEVTFDSRALRGDNDLHLFLTPTNADASAVSGEYWHDDNWNAQWGAVLSVDLDQLPLLQGGIARRAGIKTVAGAGIAPDQASITATAVAVIPGSFGLSTPPEMRNKRAVARMIVKAAVSAASTTLTTQMRMLQQDGGGGLVYLGTLTFTSTTSLTKATPWIPIPNGPVNGYDAQVQGFAYKAGTGNGIIYSATIEYGYLAGPTD